MFFFFNMRWVKVANLTQLVVILSATAGPDNNDDDAMWYVRRLEYRIGNELPDSCVRGLGAEGKSRNHTRRMEGTLLRKDILFFLSSSFPSSLLPFFLLSNASPLLNFSASGALFSPSLTILLHNAY